MHPFPYYNNYVDLARLELSALQTAAHPAAIETICFVGSGPLPMTSICFATLPITPLRRIHNIDCDAHAIDVSSQLCARLDGMGGMGSTGSVGGTGIAMGTGTAMDKALLMTFEHADASAVEGLAAFDAVFVAGLVGGESVAEKTRILAHVVRRCRPGALLVLRSAHGVRRLLYPQVDLTSLASLGLRVILVVHPWNHIVNSVVVCRVLGGAKL